MQDTRRGSPYIYNNILYIYSILEGVCSSVDKSSLALTVSKQALKCLIPSKCSKLSEKE